MENVTFTPHYTLRAESTGKDSSLQIRYQARISNNSGEDWNEVSLAISTAQASETTVIPQMMRWTVDFRSPVGNYYGLQKAMKQRSLFQSAAPMQHVQAQALYRSAPPPPPPGAAFGGHGSMDTMEEADMATAAAEVSEGITSTFLIPGKQTIKDGEKSHTVVIRDLTLQGKFANICVPKIKDVAYLQVYYVTCGSDARLASKIILITLYFLVRLLFSLMVPSLERQSSLTLHQASILMFVLGISP
jgi:uncharacterized protein (TIGR02231 family)